MGDISVRVFGKTLRNPILNASGTLGYGKEIERLWKIDTLGAFVTKGLSYKPHFGNPQPRISDLGFGMLNSIGLQNIGIRRFLDEYLDFFIGRNTPVIINVFGFTEEDYERCVAEIDRNPIILALEVNLSCPNVKEGGILFGKRPDKVHDIIRRIKSITDIPVLAKLSPVSDIKEVAKAAYEAGADGLTLINTIPGATLEDRGMIFGGISGPFLKSIALRAVYECSKALPIPIIGVGGIFNTNDCISFFNAGALLVQIGTSTFLDPFTIPKIVRELNLLAEKTERDCK